MNPNFKKAASYRILGFLSSFFFLDILFLKHQYLPYFLWEAKMTKDQLVAKIKELLKTDADLEFLLELKKKEIETLIACIRDRVG